MQEEATCTCSECGQPVPESYEPVTVTIPERPLAGYWSRSRGWAEPEILEQARVQITTQDPELAFWNGPTLSIAWGGGNSVAQIALDHDPKPGPNADPELWVKWLRMKR